MSNNEQSYLENNEEDTSNSENIKPDYPDDESLKIQNNVLTNNSEQYPGTDKEAKNRSNSFKSKDTYFRVSNPVTKEGIKNYIQYTVECSLNKQILYKRYSDFDALRQKIVERWPGLYVPNIPKKKLVGNLESTFIGTRCRQLNNFAEKLLSIPYYFNGEELKFFLFSEEVEKSLNKLPKESFDEILMKYKLYLLNFYKEDGKNIDDKIQIVNNFMNKVLVKTLTTIRVSFNYFIFRILKMKFKTIWKRNLRKLKIRINYLKV